MTARRPPRPTSSVYLTPTPGRRVWRSSGGIRAPSGECREEAAAEPLRLAHQEETDRRRREHVESGEGNEVGAVGGGDHLIVGGELREDDGELAVGDERRADVQVLAQIEAGEQARAPARRA